MRWFKHLIGSHDDPDISDAFDKFGDFGYAGFFIILEIYGQEYKHRNSEDFITISKTFLKRKLRKNLRKVELLLNFYSKKQKIISIIEKTDIMIKVPKFIELADNWSTRKLCSSSVVTTALNSVVTTEMEKKEEEKEKEKEKEEEIKKEIYKERKWVFKQSDFERFWKVYPVKNEKKKCIEKWKVIKPETELVEKIIKAIQEQIEWRSKAKLGEFRPVWKNPLTWLNGECWNDEILIENEKQESVENKLVIEMKNKISEYREKIAKENPELQKWFQNGILEYVKKEIGDISYNAWFKDLIVISMEENILYLHSTEFSKKWIKKHYPNLFNDILYNSDLRHSKNIPEEIIILTGLPE